MAELKWMRADQLERYMGNPNVLLIDLRNRREYEQDHIPGAINMPYQHLLEHVCLPKKKTIILYCERGSASMAEGKDLAEKGWKVYTLIGGMHAYRELHLVKPAKIR